MRKLRDENFYKVVNKDTGRILAKKTTDKNGKKMIKLLNYIDAKKYKIDIDKLYYETINFILIEAYELSCSPLIKSFIKNLCYDDFNRDIIITYIAIFRYVSKLLISDIYHFRKNYV